MAKIDLGSGLSPKQGYITVDKSSLIGADYHLDITKDQLPFGDDSIDEINAGCILEQIDSNEGFIRALNECWRALKGWPEGKLVGYVPTPDPRVMWLDPMDRRFFLPETFNYFDVDQRAWQQFGKSYGFLQWRNITTEVKENGILHFEMYPAK